MYMRLLTSLLWVLITLAFAFDAVAQPCDLQTQLDVEADHVLDAEMPCHDGMMTDEAKEPQDAPEHHKDTCCCAAVLKTMVDLEKAELKQPLPGIVAWASPLNDKAISIPFEYEPPPPRA